MYFLYCTATKADGFIIQCMYTLYNSLGNVTGHHGKHFLVSRQTLWYMAYQKHAKLLSLPGFNSLACGGIVLVPDLLAFPRSKFASIDPKMNTSFKK
jgi:hypothetical protein